MVGGSRLDHFSALDDPRQSGKVGYPLPEILRVVLCGTMAGAENFVEIERWANRKLAFLRRLRPFGRGVAWRGVPRHAERRHERPSGLALRRPDLARRLVRLAYPRTLPVVLSRDEVARLLNATTCLKHQAALSVAYGVGLRVAEVSALKVTDIDSQRMLIRVERGKGGQYRNALLSADLLTLLRQWWRVGRERGVMQRDGWLFPGQHALKPISTPAAPSHRRRADRAADIAKRVGSRTLRHSFATHLLEGGTAIG